MTHFLCPNPFAPLPGPWADFKITRWGMPTSHRARMCTQITLSVGIQHVFVEGIGILVAGGKTVVRLGGEHGRWSKTFDTRVGCYIDSRGFPGKTGDVDFTIVSNSRVYK